MSRLDEVGEADAWRCWLCDQPVDASMTDDRGPSIDQRVSNAKSKKGNDTQERLAHRGCNTKKGAVAAVVPWREGLFLSDPAPIIAAADRLVRKGGREVMARCPTQEDAEDAASWLVDRLSRLHPDLQVTTEINEGGGQYLIALRAN